MSTSIDRVTAALREHGIEPAVRMLDERAHTAAIAAAGLGVEVGQIANSLVFEADGEPLLVVASGGRRVDTELLARRLGLRAIKRATPEFVRSHTGFAIGGVAPVGHPSPLRTVVDTALGRWDEVWAAAGHPHSVFPTDFDELVRITGGVPAAVREEEPAGQEL